MLLPDHYRADRWGYVREHILIAEKALGKSLPAGAIVHHTNGTKDSGPLVICENQAYHNLIHQRTRAYVPCGHANWLQCKYCRLWDDPKNLYIRKNSNTGWHRKCHAVAARKTRTIE